jgi:hypothetical protein
VGAAVTQQPRRVLLIRSLEKSNGVTRRPTRQWLRRRGRRKIVTERGTTESVRENASIGTIVREKETEIGSLEIIIIGTTIIETAVLVIGIVRETVKGKERGIEIERGKGTGTRRERG